MAESKRTPRWRYLGAAGGMLGALMVVLLLVAGPTPVQPLHRASMRTQDVGSQTSVTAPGSKTSAANQSAGSTVTRSVTSTTSGPIAHASHAGATASSTTTSSTAGRTGALSAALGAAADPGTSTTTSTAAGPDPSTECSGTTPPTAAPSGGWQCTFDDEFNGTSLDTSKWQPQLTSASGYTTGAPPDLVCYVDNPETISESGGTLNLSVVQTPTAQACGQTQTQYEGGMVSSYQIFDQRYGFFEARAKLPASTLDGLQETLWLYPENETLFGPFPDSGEIDYGEFYSEYPTTDVPVVHYPGSQDDPNATNDYCSIAGAETAGEFNTYALLWTPTTITAYFNGVPCITDTYAPYVQGPDAAPAPLNQPFFMAFTAALGVGTDSPEGQDMSQELPATTSLDWMRVWQYG